MADIALTVADIRPLPGSEIVQFDAGGALTVGDTVYIASDGDVEEADASAAGTAYAVGIVIAGKDDQTTFVAGDTVSVLVRGRVTGFSSATPNDVVYQSDTAGAIADAAGTTSHKVGRMLNATTLYFVPAVTEA